MSDPVSCTVAPGASEAVRGERGSPRMTRHASFASVLRPRSLARLDGRESLSLSLLPGSFIDTLIRRASFPHGSSLSFAPRFSSRAGVSGSTFVHSCGAGSHSRTSTSTRSSSSSVIGGLAGAPASISPTASRASLSSPGWSKLRRRGSTFAGGSSSSGAASVLRRTGLAGTEDERGTLRKSPRPRFAVLEPACADSCAAAEAGGRIRSLRAIFLNRSRLRSLA